MSRKWVRSLLRMGLNSYQRRLLERTLNVWETAFFDSPRVHADTLPGNERKLCELLTFFFRGQLQKEQLEITALRRAHEEFLKRLSRVATPADRDQCILDFARSLGSSPKELRLDRKALRRWFDSDCVTERAERQRHTIEFRLVHALDRLGALGAEILKHATSPAQRKSYWAQLGLESAIEPLLAYDGDVRVVRAAIATLDRVLRAWSDPPQHVIEHGTLQFVFQAALQPSQDTWVQRSALDLIAHVSPDSLLPILEKQITNREGRDDIFVRKRVVEILVETQGHSAESAALLEAAANDPSPFVRQGFARALERAAAPVVLRWLGSLVTSDPVPQVRAAATIAAIAYLGHPDLHAEALRAWSTAVTADEDDFVRTVALESIDSAFSERAVSAQQRPKVWHQLASPIEACYRNAPSIEVRRRAALARERLWARTHGEAIVVRSSLQTILDETPPGERLVLPPELLATHGEEMLGRTLSVLAQHDFGFDIELQTKQLQGVQGPLFGFRWWRFLNELRHPGPDKRQAFHHTVGRVFTGSLRAPSAVLAELAETKVPGEPLFIEDEGGWRPYLPLVDDLVSSVSLWGHSRPFSIYTAEGITDVLPPRNRRQCRKAALQLTWNFAEHARRRNWRAADTGRPSEYLEEIQRMGFEFRLRPYDEASTDVEVRRFFPTGAAGILPPLLPEELWYPLQDYFFSLYENSIVDLLLFGGGTLALFLGRHWHANRALERARRNLPLVVGGWGTRGKSGSERLKAALFNALGYSVVSKTTGCEAMFLYCHPFGKIHELFLFRSYDKATIWEQANIVKLASALEADVFLWECMGLKPEYVDILQRQWMQDDIATLTNAYPDHEDVQGPAGFNIPEAMTQFIPAGSRLITCEELMLPILAQDSREKRTSVRAVNTVEAGLLTRDVLERFPYEEHPSNVAMILVLAEELGVEQDFALKEIADFVVPDLGVLKTYPAAGVRGRVLEFTNGNSANDRHGALGNYRRLGFDRQERTTEPTVWKTTLVNNRADRIPRSRVFARILVEDITADRHYLIGDNLNGLVGYIRESWDEAAARLKLWPETGEFTPFEILEREAGRRRVPRSAQELLDRLHGMVSSNDDSAAQEIVAKHWLDPTALRDALAKLPEEHCLDAIERVHKAELAAYQEYREFRMELEGVATADQSNTDARFRDLLWTWFERTIVVVENYHISGDGIIDLIAEDTPPGYTNRVLGLQNIKGTGLDFVYRWQAWDACASACQRLLESDAARSREGLRSLVAFQEHGLLTAERVTETLDQFSETQHAQSEQAQAQMALVRSNLASALARIEDSAQDGSGGNQAWVSGVEGFLDPGDSVRRRRTADRIYRDLADGRIASERAVVELKKLIQRQKGGWLAKRLDGIRRRLLQAFMRHRRSSRETEARTRPTPASGLNRQS